VTVAARSILELTEWRRTVAALYREVRDSADPQAGHALWRAGRDDLFRTHPQSPLAADDPMRESGVPYWPYDPALRWTLPLQLPPEDQAPVEMQSDSSDGQIRLRRIGQIALPLAGSPTLDVWWLDQYAGGLWLPLRDGTSQVGYAGSYGGGRYLLDTSKGADLGGSHTELTIDLNFLYHPSCRYSPEWACPLAPPGNRIAESITAGERMS
jgi:uncharacterized protein (DUF1684 family)